jgi:hypothetical protein
VSERVALAIASWPIHPPLAERQEEIMSLRDILTGIQNGPRGAPQPQSGKSGGVSPLVLALLGLLAYKAFKGRGEVPTAPGQAAPPGTQAPGGGLGDILGGLFGGSGAGRGGRGANLNDLLRGGLGGLLGGGAAGSVLSGGLGNLIPDGLNIPARGPAATRHNS